MHIKEIAARSPNVLSEKKFVIVVGTHTDSLTRTYDVYLTHADSWDNPIGTRDIAKADFYQSEQQASMDSRVIARYSGNQCHVLPVTVNVSTRYYTAINHGVK